MKIVGDKNAADMFTKTMNVNKLWLCIALVVSKWEIVGVFILFQGIIRFGEQILISSFNTLLVQ